MDHIRNITQISTNASMQVIVLSTWFRTENFVKYRIENTNIKNKHFCGFRNQGSNCNHRPQTQDLDFLSSRHICSVLVLASNTQRDALPYQVLISYDMCLIRKKLIFIACYLLCVLKSANFYIPFPWVCLQMFIVHSLPLKIKNVTNY